MTDANSPSNMQDFTTDSYNLTFRPQSWCVTPGSIYTNKFANYNYFNKKCGDPYTYYAYWYRRFPSETKYLNCYYLPNKDIYFQNTYGYLNSGKNCNTIPSNHVNGYFGGFKYFDTRTNASSARVQLTPNNPNLNGLNLNTKKLAARIH